MWPNLFMHNVNSDDVMPTWSVHAVNPNDVMHSSCKHAHRQVRLDVPQYTY